MFHLVARRHLGIDQVAITIYPGFQMVFVDDQLFKVHEEWDELENIWTLYLKLLQDVRVDTTCQVFTGNWPFIASGLVGPNLGFHVPMHEKTGANRWTCKFEGVRILVYLQRIQRMVKCKYNARRRLAVLMCLHDRLGQDSLLGWLPVDLITQMI
jgi:hypothetical protein